MDKVPAAGTKEFKRPPETSAGTARDYSTTFRVACKDCRHVKFVLSVITERAQRKEEFESSARSSARFSRGEGFARSRINTTHGTQNSSLCLQSGWALNGIKA